MDYDALMKIMTTQRAIRAFAPRPVDDALIEKALRAATRAPSGGNRQPWRFIVVRDRETKAKLGAIFDELGASRPGGAPQRMPWQEVPALIAVCSESGAEGSAAAAAETASIYPAVQNLLLAAHALGLGTVLTTRWKARESEIRPHLALPESMSVHAIIPIGWPDRRYGRGTRRPAREVTYRERYGQPWR